MFAATAAGIYSKVEDAMAAMGQGFDESYYPDAERAAIYAKRYRKFNGLGQSIEALTAPLKKPQVTDTQKQVVSQ